MAQLYTNGEVQHMIILAGTGSIGQQQLNMSVPATMQRRDIDAPGPLRVEAISQQGRVGLRVAYQFPLSCLQAFAFALTVLQRDEYPGLHEK